MIYLALLIVLLFALPVRAQIAVSANDTTEILVWGGDNGCTLDFNTGGASSASVTVNGFLL